MKTIGMLFITLLFVNFTFAQSKKDNELKILQLEEKTKQLENEITNIKTNLTNTTTTLGLVSKTNLDLEKIVKDQSMLIEKLIKQNDSLLTVFKVKQDSDIVTAPKNEEDSIIFLIQNYYACKKWEYRLAYVLNPEMVNPYMKAHYTDNYESVIVKKNIISIQGGGYKLNETFKVVLDGAKIVYCIKTNNGFKIDWEATVGYNPVSLLTFQASLSATPTRFRVMVNLTTDCIFIESKTNWCVYINTMNNGFVRGYISKSSVEGKKIYEILKDGKEHQLILELKIDATTDGSGGTALVTSVFKEGW